MWMESHKDTPVGELSHRAAALSSTSCPKLHKVPPEQKGAESQGTEVFWQLTVWMGPRVRNRRATLGMPRDSAHMSCQCKSWFRW